MGLTLLILAFILFIFADIIIRYAIKSINEKKLRKERETILHESIIVDFSTEAKSLKRTEVPNPKAKILCVDDEDVILDSFRKILVLDGYSVDTVNSGPEVFNLIKTNHYDFLFTDLKMPEMSGTEVTKTVKHLRPDIDVVIITGYATVETAVECMKYGAADYVQKPFTEDELLEFTKKSLVKRLDRIQKQLKPRVHITHLSESEKLSVGEFAIPGGVFISPGHTWAAVTQDGTVKVGIDDFAKKLLGKIDDISFPNLGMSIQKSEPLFSIKQGKRTTRFNSPVSGVVSKLNHDLHDDLHALDYSPYEKNWFCTIDAEKLDTELAELKIGKNAVNYYQEEIERFIKQMKEILKDENTSDDMYWGEIEKLDEKNWYVVTGEFFNK
ncbi:MAG: sigma-54 dependent DNA-binding response regulator [Ignavibacteria bacterium]|nr:MAG: sigma-54 dependent DNA-binding response regulator [Ignavibacteria bacterium]KAF0161429.1 MAG: sigma-54 dependent DNA-binding response regulator [Ignavibacteria bacterium]